MFVETLRLFNLYVLPFGDVYFISHGVYKNLTIVSNYIVYFQLLGKDIHTVWLNRLESLCTVTFLSG
jgi:hypothetical protein